MNIRNSKKILFLIPTLDMGGGERIVSELSLNLPQDIQKIIVLFENKIAYPYQGKLISLDILSPKNFFLKLYYLLIGFLRFKKIVNQEKPDWVISFDNSPNIFNILNRRNSILRIDNSLSSAGYRGFRRKLYKVLVRFLFNKSTKIIVVSKGLENELIKNFKIKKEKIKVIYNPIDIKKIRSLSNEALEIKYKKIFEYPVIISIGRLTEQKGQWHLIRAFKETKKRIKDFKLVILGEGELESYLKGLIKNLNLENDIYLLGWQKNPFKFLAKSKLFVLSSFWEGLGIAILEAMACGVPVISSDCKSGPREILAPDSNIDYQTKNIEYAQYGVLFPVCDGKFYGVNDSLTKNEKILSEAMVEILSNKELLDSLTKKSRKRVEDFDVKKIIKEYEFL